MNSVPTRFKSSKSRIPVPVKCQISSADVIKKEAIVNKLDPKAQATRKTSNPCFIQRKPTKQPCSQNVQPSKAPNDRLTKITGTAQSSLRTNVKSESSKENLKTNIKSDGSKKKDLLLKTELKSNFNKGKSLVSSKSNLKSCDNSNPKFQPLKTSAKSISGVLQKQSSSNDDCEKERIAPSLKSACESGNVASTLRSITNDSPKKFSTPKRESERESKVSSKVDCFSAQKGIKFEANEIYRKMILNGELPPNNFRSSSIYSQRPSVYQKMEIPSDPLKEFALAMEKINSSVKGVQKPVIQLKVAVSPFKERSSICTPYTNPKLEALRSLEKLKWKQQQKSALKSAKKVTFNLKVEECNPEISSSELKFKSSDLTQINEKSEENTPNSPSNERTKVSSSESNKENSPPPGLQKTDSDSVNHQGTKATGGDIEPCDFSLTLCTPVTKCVPVHLIPEKLPPAQLCKEQETDSSSSNFVSHSIQTVNDGSEKHQRTTNFQKSEQNDLKEENIKFSRSKVYTPRPVSFYIKPKLMDSSSPELLGKGGAEALLKSAPICTPMVLRSVAKSTALSPETDLSPVRLKLDFTEKDSPKKEIPKSRKLTGLENIVTCKSILDVLADEECSLWLSNQSIPVVCGRYLKDPVALTLLEGDEMHFIPLQF